MNSRHSVDLGSTESDRAAALVDLQAAALDATANAVVITDRTGTVIWVNSAFEQLTGYAYSEIVGQSTRMLKSGINPPQLYEGMWQTILRGRIWRGELVNRRKDGSLYDEEMTITPVRNRGGDITHYIGIKLDISDRRQSETKLQMLSDRLSLATAVAKIGVWELDLARHSFTWDTTTFEIYGMLPVDSLPYERWSATVHPADLPAVEATLHRAIDAKGVGSAEFRIILADGTLKHVSVVGRVIVDERGSVSRVLGTAQDITERKRAEGRLHMLANAIENSPDLVGMGGPDGGIVYVNDALQKALQYSKQELLGKHFRNILSQNNPSALLEEIESKSLRPGGWRGECLVPRKDGTDLQVLLSSSAVMGEDGQALGILGIAQDITEQKRAEGRISLLSQAMESASEFIAMGDMSGNITFANQAWLQALGYSERELVGRKFHFILSPNNPPELFAEIDAKTFAGGWRGECLQRCKDGSDLPVLLSTGQLKDREGRFAGVFGIAREITERKKMEDNLRRLAAIVESSDEAITSTSLDGIIESWNRGAERMYGYSASEAIGQPLHMLCPPGRSDEISALLEKVKRGEIVEQFESVRIRKDGKQIRIALAVSPIRDASGKIVGAAAISRDITESKQMEEMFRQAQKMEAVGRLAGGVAHDFNNMLSVIIGYSDVLLERTDTDAKLRQQCEEIKKAGERAAALTRQLLAFSRQQVLEPRVLNLNTCVVGIEKMLRRLIGEDIELRTLLDPTLGSVKGDPGQIEQVIMNLAVNARDAMHEGGKLVIETSNADLDEGYALRHPPCNAGRYVLLTVTDSGTGMSPETKARIFEPFFTTKEVGKGTGLGLATVYGVVKQSGGYVWVYSEPGRGTAFKIYLPRIDEPEWQIRPPEVAPELLQGTETILLVEDEQSVRSLTRGLLEHGGYTVLEAETGARAIEIATQHPEPIHLVLTDVVMPGMNGPTLADKILSIHPETKALYASGYSGSFGTQTGLVPAGATLLQKPFSRIALLQKVRRVLDGQAKSEIT
jgi:two-component system, cell cycle sensor histidine kinase and response regulator CckA